MSFHPFATTAREYPASTNSGGSGTSVLRDSAPATFAAAVPGAYAGTATAGTTAAAAKGTEYMYSRDDLV